MKARIRKVKDSTGTWLRVDKKYWVKVLPDGGLKVQHLGNVGYAPNPVRGRAVDIHVLLPETAAQKLTSALVLAKATEYMRGTL